MPAGGSGRARTAAAAGLEPRSWAGPGRAAALSAAANGAALPPRPRPAAGAGPGAKERHGTARLPEAAPLGPGARGAVQRPARPHAAGAPRTPAPCPAERGTCGPPACWRSHLCACCTERSAARGSPVPRLLRLTVTKINTSFRSPS